MSHEAKQQFEQLNEKAAPGTSEVAVEEVNDNRPALVQKQKDYISYLKNGGISGISAEFGKPMWLISETGDATGLRKPINSPNLEDERKELSQLAVAQMPKADFERFQRDMSKFEARLGGGGDNLSAAEIARTYQEISRILEAKGEHPIKTADRLAIAEQVMHQAADPTSIDQGKHATCNVATIECRVYSLKPSEAARLVADVVVNGDYETQKGKIVKPSTDSLKPDWEAKNNPPRDGDRSYASQIFQVTAVNIYHVNETGGQIRYEQRTPDAKIPGDSGERLIDVKTGPNAALVDDRGRVIQAPRVPLDALPHISEEITGKFEKDLLIVPSNRTESPNWTRVESPRELEITLKQLKQVGKLPVVLPVWNNNEPLLKDCGGGAPRGDQGQHVITIAGFDETTGKWKIDNQFGHKSDRSFSVEELYSLTQSAYSPEKVEALHNEVQRNRRENKIDTYKELEWVRAQWGTGQIANELELEAALTRVRVEAEQRWRQQKDNGTYDAKEEARARQKLGDIASVLPKLLEMRVTGKTTFIGR